MSRKKGLPKHLHAGDPARMAELRRLAFTPEARAKAAATRKRNAEARKAAKALASISHATAEVLGAHEGRKAHARGMAALSAGTASARGKKAKKEALAAALGVPVSMMSEAAPVVVVQESNVSKPKKSAKKAAKKSSTKKPRKAAKRTKKAKKSTASKKPRKAPKRRKSAKKAAAPKKAKKGRKKSAKKSKAKKGHAHHHAKMVPGHKKGSKRACPKCGQPHSLREHWSHKEKPATFNYRRKTKSGKAHKGRGGNKSGLLSYIFG